MNERIDQLLVKAGAYFGAEGVLYDQFDPEKFAELIVKEYDKLLPETCPWVDADKEGPMKGWHVQFVARKHFGIEK